MEVALTPTCLEKDAMNAELKMDAWYVKVDITNSDTNVGKIHSGEQQLYEILQVFRTTKL